MQPLKRKLLPSLPAMPLNLRPQIQQHLQECPLPVYTRFSHCLPPMAHRNMVGKLMGVWPGGGDQQKGVGCLYGGDWSQVEGHGGNDRVFTWKWKEENQSKIPLLPVAWAGVSRLA